jgi:hypothetical protein
MNEICVIHSRLNKLRVERAIVDTLLGNRDTGYLYHLLGDIDSEIKDLENDLTKMKAIKNE